MSEENHTCFYRKYPTSIDKTYPFNIADRVEVISHIPQHLMSGRINKGDTLVISEYPVYGIQEKIKLNKTQTDSLFSILYNFTNKAGDHRRMDCNQPRHAIIFYAKNIPIDYIDLCIECSQVNHSKEINLPAFCSEKWFMLENYFKSIGIKYGYRNTDDFNTKELTDSSNIIQFIPPDIKE